MKNISNWINVDKGIKVKTKEDFDQNLNFHAFRSPKQSKIVHFQNKSIFINLQSACFFEAVCLMYLCPRWCSLKKIAEVKDQQTLNL